MTTWAQMTNVVSEMVDPCCHLLKLSQGNKTKEAPLCKLRFSYYLVGIFNVSVYRLIVEKQVKRNCFVGATLREECICDFE